MNFLLDTETCSAHLKRPAGLTHRFIQHSGRLFVPTIVVGELYSWAYRRQQPSSLLERINELLSDLPALNFDSACGLKFGQVSGLLSQRGLAVPTTDLMIASLALVHDLTLVTHNTIDYLNFPELRLDDWLT